ncbi:MAG: hypothetical protein GX241_04095 [Ruminococcaceae bacterium]|nr:hypothetical protein [Oscillospiraceae bacterium]
MKKRHSKITAILLATVMMFSLSACSLDMDFLAYGWDGEVDGEIVWINEKRQALEKARENENVDGEASEETGAASGETGEAGKTDAEAGDGEDASTENGKDTGATKTDAQKKTDPAKKTGGGTSTGTPSSGTKPTAPPAGKTYTTAEAIDLYKAAANPIKTTTGKSITATRVRETYTEVGENNLSGPSAGIVKKAFGPKDDRKEVVVNGQSDLIKKFVVEKQNYVCNLTANDVKSATVKTSGSNTIVTIYVKDDTSGQNYSNKAVSATAVYDIAKIFMSGVSMSCKNVRVTATIDGNGRLVHLNTYMPAYFTKGDESFGAAIEQWWEISYK